MTYPQLVAEVTLHNRLSGLKCPIVIIVRSYPSVTVVAQLWNQKEKLYICSPSLRSMHHSTAQHSTVQHSTASCSAFQCPSRFSLVDNSIGRCTCHTNCCALLLTVAVKEQQPSSLTRTSRTVPIFLITTKLLRRKKTPSIYYDKRQFTKLI